MFSLSGNPGVDLKLELLQVEDDWIDGATKNEIPRKSIQPEDKKL